MATRVAAPADRSPRPGATARPHNLPAQPTRLIGRERDLEAVRGRLLRADVRLVTLTGPAGTGKTRLAIEAAALLLDDLADGACFVDLAPIRDPDLVAAAIAQALEAPDTGGRPAGERMTDYLRDRQLLLVLDNCEQVLTAAPQLADLLGACPRLKLLATSREPLHLRWEHEVPVQPLAVPDLARLPPLDALAATPAVALFVQRAQAVHPDFALDAANAATVAAICVRLEGLPLAIELAAARSRLLAPPAILARLGRRLGLLTGGAADLPARQRTLRGALAWSHDLLTAEEQVLFRRLGVFVGGCTLEAVHAVCNAEGALGPDLLDAVASLVDKSLLRRPDGRDGEPRLTMLDTIREYAEERLGTSGEAEALARRHAEHYLALAEAAWPVLRSSDVEAPAWYARLDAEAGNARAALDWAVGRGETELAVRLTGALRPLWLRLGHPGEGRRYAEAMLALPALAARTPERASMLKLAGDLAATQQDLAAARARLEEAVAVSREIGDSLGLAYALDALGNVLSKHDLVAARSVVEEAATLIRAQGDRLSLAIVLRSLGGITRQEGNEEAAHAHFEESLALARDLGSTRDIASNLLVLGEIAARCTRRRCVCCADWGNGASSLSTRSQP